MKFFFLSLLFLCLSPQVFAADPTMPVPLQNLAKDGAQVRYLGRDQGLDGWMTFKDSQVQYFYATPDLQGIVMGVLFNNKGDVVTLRQLDALRKREPGLDSLMGGAAPAAVASAPVRSVAKTEAKAEEKTVKPSSGKAQQLFNDVEKSRFVSLGQNTAPVIYTFIDPQCPHCHKMLDQIRKSAEFEKGRIAVRVIPVGLMNEESLQQAAYLLAAADGPARLAKHLDGDKNALPADGSVNTQAVQQNILLMQNWKLDVTPFSVYKNKNGEIKIIRGVPDDLGKLAADLK